MPLITQKLQRKQRRSLKKLKHSKTYLFYLSVIFFVFPPVKKFVIHPVKSFQKIFGMISFSVMKVFGFKVGLIDDFIIHKKLRGKGVAQELFGKTETELKKQDVDIVILTSGSERKASHKFYKKAGMTIIGFGVGILAYKVLKTDSRKQEK